MEARSASPVPERSVRLGAPWEILFRDQARDCPWCLSYRWRNRIREEAGSTALRRPSDYESRGSQGARHIIHRQLSRVGWAEVTPHWRHTRPNGIPPSNGSVDSRKDAAKPMTLELPGCIPGGSRGPQSTRKRRPEGRLDSTYRELYQGFDADQRVTSPDSNPSENRAKSISPQTVTLSTYQPTVPLQPSTPRSNRI